MENNIRKFTTGAVRDSEDGKESYGETISWTGLRLYAEFMTSKKKKYGEGNFKKGIPDESYEESLIRHYQKYMENKYEKGDREIGDIFGNYMHICAIIFNAFGLLHNFGMRKKEENEGSTTITK